MSRTFLHVVDVLHQRLKPLIIWPDREVLRKTLPMDFNKYCPNCVVIIDCFEIFLHRPLNPLARAQTFSSYEPHNTVKYLIGITPQGTVSFISEGWGGRVSDKHCLSLIFGHVIMTCSRPRAFVVFWLVAILLERFGEKITVLSFCRCGNRFR